VEAEAGKLVLGCGKGSGSVESKTTYHLGHIDVRNPPGNDVEDQWQ
jgi:hypothetical protein